MLKLSEEWAARHGKFVECHTYIYDLDEVAQSGHTKTPKEEKKVEEEDTWDIKKQANFVGVKEDASGNFKRCIMLASTIWDRHQSAIIYPNSRGTSTATGTAPNTHTTHTTHTTRAHCLDSQDVLWVRVRSISQQLDIIVRNGAGLQTAGMAIIESCPDFAAPGATLRSISQ